jgi:hypothetical protein
MTRFGFQATDNNSSKYLNACFYVAFHNKVLSLLTALFNVQNSVFLFQLSNFMELCPCRAKRFFSFSQRPDLLWGPTILLPIGDGNYFSGDKTPGA